MLLKVRREASPAKRSKTPSKKRRKTHTTRAYRKTEKEVETLLQLQAQRQDGRMLAGHELEARSLNFFHALDDDDEQARAKSVEQAAATAESEDDSAAEVATGAASATYIQIELAEPVVWPKLYSHRHYHDDSLLYSPSDTPHFQLQLNDLQLTRSQTRMLNRYQEEAKSVGNKLSAELIAQLSEAPSFIIDATLYRSECAREFQSVFFAPAPASHFEALPMPRCLKLRFQRLRFSSHPQMLDEHRQAQQLEDLYDNYKRHIQQQTCEKLRQELQIARKVAAAQLRRMAPGEAQDQAVSHIQRQLRLTQQLRQRYYAEATLQRTLLKQLLEQWAKLKELRQQQQFQCTRFQLSLRVVQPMDLNAACAAWKAQFEADLSEVYREHLEAYYCRRRLWSERPAEAQSKPPRKPQFEKIMAHLKAQYERAFKDPEEPQVEVLRVHVDEAQLSTVPGAEQLQRGRSYFMKIYLDEQFVAQTRSYRLEPDLHLYMNECIGVLLERALPEQLRIWLYEKATLTPHSRRLAQLTAPLTIDSGSAAAQHKLSFEAAAVGSTAKRAGELYLHIDHRQKAGGACAVDDVQQLPEQLRRRLLSRRLPAPSLTTAAKATPKPPFSRPKKTAKAAAALPPLIFAEQQLQFCGIETLLGNKRFQLLHSRQQQRNLHTKQLRFVPALEHELAADYALTPSAAKVLEPGSCWNPIDLHKHRGRRFLQLLYETIRSQSALRAKALQTPAPLLLAQGELAGWTALWRALLGLFVAQPQSLPREPHLEWRPQETPQGQQRFQVALHVVRATGVPVRSRHILNVESRRRSDEGGGDMSASLFVTQTLMYSNVRPFIALSYGQRLCRSSTAEGSNPTWNEQLQLQFSGQLSDLREDLKITLFDELVEQEFSDGHGADIYQRVQCNWLGEYRVPLSSLLASKKFEGCVELCMPKVLVGYKRPLIDSVTHLAAEQYPEFKESVHLWFYLSVECSCELPPMQTEALACAELPELQQHLREMRLELQQLQPQRFVEPVVATAHGKRVCLTRLLEPVPLAVSSSENVLDSACRFVALLCQLRSYDACLGLQGVWLDNQTLLDSTWASAKDLGVLLCNFMLAQGVQCWLVLGLGCPLGQCAFVLYRQPDSGELLLVSPSSGKRFGTKDVHCPLQRIYCIVAPQNIYYNMQLEPRVSLTNFNLGDGACWLPLFNRRQPAPQSGVQKLDYVYKRSYDLSELQKHIERKVMKKINAWRATRKTIWNRAFQPRLLSILREMEKLSTFVSSRYDEPPYSEQLEREFPNYRLYGFTLNFAYTNLAAISERIRTTCLHYNNNPTVEFCVAVHINAYANDVLSVWLFILSIVPLI